MNWSFFKTHGEAPSRAFEAFCGVLFERWCRRKYGANIEHIYYVNGSGGDGGVEAYAKLKDGDLIGLQTKWFLNSIGDTQLSQIKKSISTAASVRKGLIRYVVAVPRDLCNKKILKQKTNTERDKWNNFAMKIKGDFPSLCVELWDDTRLGNLLAELGSEGLQRYWFDRTVININDLDRLFQQARYGWLSKRYAPDLHQVGLIQYDLKIRMVGARVVPEWRQEINNISCTILKISNDIIRLKRFPDLLKRTDSDKAIDFAEEWLLSADRHIQEILCCFASECSFPVTISSTCTPPWEGLAPLLNHLEQFKGKGIGLSPFDPYKKNIDQLIEKWSNLSITPDVLHDFSRPVAYIGEPGAGKTDALANAVEWCLQSRIPALLVRAKDFAPNQSWDAIIRKVVGEPSWTLPQIFDALEASATQADVQRAAADKKDGIASTSRLLIAIDGLDESVRAEQWEDRINELEALINKWPRILIACGYRSSLSRRFSGAVKLSTRDVQKSDAPLGQVFRAYCKSANIVCPPLLRWALQSPLSIRLFAELFKGKTITEITLAKFSIPELMRKKIEHVETAIRDADSDGWSASLTPVRQSIRAIVTSCFEKGRAITSDEALDAVEVAVTPKAVFTRERLLALLHQCSNSGLLLFSRMPPENPLDDDTRLWEPAYEFLTDYFLASEAVKSVKDSPDGKDIPEYLRQRPNTRALTVSLLGAEGYHFLESGLWEDDLSLESRDELQLTAIFAMPTNFAEYYRPWVMQMFTRNMPSCRRVLRQLIVPGLRIPDYPFGARFVHGVLLPMTVPDRDLFWSGPHYIPKNHDGIWEGYGDDILEHLTISSDDPWHAAPLLLAWATTTVDNKNRRRIRAELAKWGTNNAVGLLELLKTTLQTNDPQMKEDIVSAVYGSACLCRPDETWIPISNWIINNFFVPTGPLKTDNIVIRHATLGIVERLLISGVVVDAHKLEYVKNPSINTEKLLPVDKHAATHAKERTGYEPVTSDLDWYVLPKAFKPFFSEKRGAIVSKEVYDSYAYVSEEVLRAFTKKKIRSGALSESYAEARKELRKLKKADARNSFITYLESLSKEELKNLQKSLPSLDKSALSPKKRKTPAIKYSPAAKSLLKMHAKAIGVKTVTPYQFAIGIVVAYTSNLGWSKDRFYGNPNGGQPGEILGPDIAILRKYTQARHGARSTIATFAEKYVWCAVHELMGYLADRLPASEWGPPFPPPVNPALLSELTNPAMDVYFEQVEFCDAAYFAELLPTVDLKSYVQVDRANEWVLNAPLPDMQKLLLRSNQLLPEWARQDEWLVLNAFIIVREEDSQAETAFWVSSAVFNSKYADYVTEDGKQQLLPDFNEYAAGIERIGTYVDPNEAVWAPWITENEQSTAYTTLDDDGKPLSIEFVYGTSKMHWESKEGEDEQFMPALWLRTALNVIDVRGGHFITATGETIAFLAEAGSDNVDVKHSRILFVRRDALENLLKQESKTLCWSTRVYREPSAYLIQDGWPRKQMDYRGFVMFQEGNISTHELSKNAGDW